MKNEAGYTSIPLSNNRRAVIASATVSRGKNAIHFITDVDITEPRLKMKEHFVKTGEKLSLTAYIVACVAHVVKEHPQLNSFIKGRRLILLDDVVVSVLIERDLGGEKVPEPIGIQRAQEKTFQQIHNELRQAKKLENGHLGSLSGSTWIRLIPTILLKPFIRIADRNIAMAKRYGKIAVTSVGMFNTDAVWCIPHGTATVLITVGSIGNKVVDHDGQYVTREHLNLTASFDHNIIDGAPASRFLNQLLETVKSGKLIQPIEDNS